MRVRVKLTCSIALFVLRIARYLLSISMAAGDGGATLAERLDAKYPDATVPATLITPKLEPGTDTGIPTGMSATQQVMFDLLKTNDQSDLKAALDSMVAMVSGPSPGGMAAPTAASPTKLEVGATSQPQPAVPANAPATSVTFDESAEHLADADAAVPTLKRDFAATKPLSLPAGISEPVFALGSERAKMWAKYTRSLATDDHARKSRASGTGGDAPAESATKIARTKRSTKVPPEILTKLIGQHEKSYYFAVWMHHQGDWADVRAYEEQLREHRKGSKEVKAWLMESEMLKLFDSQEVVQALKESCRNNITENEVRLHPKVPHCAAATQYHVPIQDRNQTKVDDVLRQGVKLELTPTGGEMDDMLIREHLKRTQKAFGGHAQASPPSSFPSEAVGPNVDDSATEHVDPGEADTSSSSRSNGQLGVAKAEMLRKLEEKERLRVEKAAQKIQDREDAVKARREKQQAEKERREEFLKSPEGRARSWLQGLQEHITKGNSEILHCQSDNCFLPKNISKEYAATWASKVATFKKARSAIEKKLQQETLPADFKQILDRAESEVSSFKSDLARYRTLEKGYKKAAERRLAEAAAV